jgi:2-polyprenyl-3-methyl-5-hydroxy-6-metoxy-1,4-benzoquinol methylase
MIENKNIPDFYSDYGQSREEYIRSHKPRFDYFAKRFELSALENNRILDVGCGLGFLFDYIDLDKNYCVGIDDTDLVPSGLKWKYIKADLNYPFADKVGEQFNLVFCLETIEHLTNPYNCLFDIKKLLLPDSYLILSIPNESITHNTIYPDQLYPVEHFKNFLRQMAFEIVLHEQHTASFKQEVFVLTSKSWENNTYRMRWPKSDENQRNAPPHISINL